MWSFFAKLFLALIVFITLIVVIPNPIHNRFPEWIKNYDNYRDPRGNTVIDIDQLEIMTEAPLTCYKNSDCELVLCGKTPNCHSFAINKEYLDKYRQDLPPEYRCPNSLELEKDPCPQTAELDLYATCDEGQCVKKHLLPTPTPSSTSIIENATYGK